MLGLSAITTAQAASEYTIAINAERYQMIMKNCTFAQSGKEILNFVDNQVNTRCAYCKVQSHGSHCPSCGAPK